MKRIITGTLFVGLALTACGTNTSVQPPRASQPNYDYQLDSRGFVAGELVIGYEEGADASALARALGATLQTDWPQLNIALLSLPEGLAVHKAQVTAEGLRGLRYAEPNYVHRLAEPARRAGAPTLSPTQVDVADPEFDVQWMHRQMNSLGAWEQGVTGAGIRIGIHDDFMDHRHPDLVDNVFYPGFDGFKAATLPLSEPLSEAFITPETPHDGTGFHGTSVAGTAAAVANDLGGRGTAYGASLVPLSISEPETGGLVNTAIIFSAVFAVLGPDLAPGGDDRAPGTDPETGAYVHIVNMSWGSDFYSQAIKDTMDFMLSYGVVLVTSAGNTPTEGPSFPSWNPGLINVAATTPRGERTNFSNRGLHLDLAAPGENIWTTTTRGCIYATPDGSSCDGENAYTYINGTSFSSPAVAGTAAMIMEASAERDAEGNIVSLPSAAQVRAILKQTSSQPSGYDRSALGAGIVDSEAAVARALGVAENPVEDGGSVVVSAVLADNPAVQIPAVGLVLIPDGDDRPVEYTQTSDGSLFVPTGLGLFQQIEAGGYTLQASGPHTATTGVPAAVAETTLTVAPGEVTEVQLEFDVETFDDPFEPNNAADEAAELDAAGITLRASLYDEDAESDVDVYALPVTGGQLYRVNFETASGSFDAALTVYDGDGNVLAANEGNQAFTSDPLVEFEVADDATVYLEVTELSGAPTANSPFNLYDLDIAPVIGDEEEPNGSAEVVGTTIQNVDFTDAQSVPLGSALNAALTEGDTDIFEVEVLAGETLVADVETEVSGEPDTLLGIYDADGQQVAFNDDYSGRESRALYSSTAGGTYFVVIAPWDAINPDNATTGDYGLMLTSHLNPPAQ